MATRFPQINPINIPLDTFPRVEQEIRTYFDTIISAVTVRRDELLQQLNDLKQDYLSKEDLRKKQVQELEQMIGQLDDMSVHQNPNLKFHEENIDRTKEELKKAEQPTPVPVPHFSSEDLQSLLQQLERIGTVQEMSSLYFDKLKPVWSIGKEGNKKGEFDYPRGIRIEGEKIYVCDSDNHRIQVFSKDGKFLTEFGKGQLVYPYDIAVYDKWAFVSDWAPNTVLKFRISNYKFMNKSVEGVLNEPCGLTVDRNEVLVADCRNHRIAVLNLDLHYLREIGKGMLKSPHDVKTDSNKIFVVDGNSSHNVHVFSKSADLLYSIISLKGGTYLHKFLCLDQFSNIIISDRTDKSIQIFTSKGQLMHSIQCGGYPRGIAVTNNNTIVCAVDHSVKFY